MSGIWKLGPLLLFAGALAALVLSRKRAFFAPLSALLTGAGVLWALVEGAGLEDLSLALLVLTAGVLCSLGKPPKGGGEG